MDYEYSLGVGVLLFFTSFGIGLLPLRKSIQVLASVSMGVVYTLVRIRFEPDPPALAGFVAFPLLYILMMSLGRLIRRKVKGK